MEGPQEVEGFLDEKEQEEKNRSDEIEDVQATYKSDKFSENADIDPMDVLDLSMDGSGSSVIV